MKQAINLVIAISVALWLSLIWRMSNIMPAWWYTIKVSAFYNAVQCEDCRKPFPCPIHDGVTK